LAEAGGRPEGVAGEHLGGVHGELRGFGSHAAQRWPLPHLPAVVSPRQLPRGKLHSIVVHAPLRTHSVTRENDVFGHAAHLLGTACFTGARFLFRSRGESIRPIRGPTINTTLNVVFMVGPCCALVCLCFVSGPLSVTLGVPLRSSAGAGLDPAVIVIAAGAVEKRDVNTYAASPCIGCGYVRLPGAFMAWCRQYTACPGCVACGLHVSPRCFL